MSNEIYVLGWFSLILNMHNVMRANPSLVFIFGLGVTAPKVVTSALSLIIFRSYSFSIISSKFLT
jgi:hypothetical protein